MIRLAPLLALAAMLAGVLVAELLEPAEPETALVQRAETRSRPPGPSRAEDSDPAPLDDLVETILDRPLLDPSREAKAGTATMPAAAGDALPRLAGVLIGPDGAKALFAATGGKPLVLGEGDRLGPYEVTKIEPNAVTLTGSEGDRLIHPSHAAAAPPAAGQPKRNGAAP